MPSIQDLGPIMGREEEAGWSEPGAFAVAPVGRERERQVRSGWGPREGLTGLVDPPRLQVQVRQIPAVAEQERAARAAWGTAIHDGGLDLDFHGFAKLFWHKGYLSGAEYALCERLYTALRACLPPPDLVIYLMTPVALAERRYLARSRPLEITRLEDLALLHSLVDTWVATLPSDCVLRVDASAPEYGTDHSVAQIAEHVMIRTG